MIILIYLFLFQAEENCQSFLIHENIKYVLDRPLNVFFSIYAIVNQDNKVLNHTLEFKFVSTECVIKQEFRLSVRNIAIVFVSMKNN